ncbi:sulfotransferase [Lyngbya aestuarii]|uniref:sulfotransferase n=1 Tax=Lyngbya aestuarii TaxID=118322 RepID=UPI00128FBFEB|nr:sulfotransferase [Lyngbya aestuarii]
MIKVKINNIKNWIFVTGVPRSGTTFVGMNLSLPLEVDYIHEPFNPQCGLPEITQWYRYVRPSLDTEEMQKYHQLTQKIFSYDFTLKTNIPENDPWQRKIIKQVIGSRGPFYLRWAKMNPFHQAAVIKDPIGNLLSEYLYVNFQVKPVIIIKHPTSFVASIKRVNFQPSPAKLNDQPHLIEDYFADEPDFLTQEWSDPVLAAAAFWRVIYKVILEQASQYPDWMIITHEELSREPVSVFQKLYHHLNLSWSESVQNKIIKQTQGNRSAEAQKGRVQDFKRNSAKIFEMRRNSLSLEERLSIFEIVKDVALKVYTEDSFAI